MRERTTDVSSRVQAVGGGFLPPRRRRLVACGWAQRGCARAVHARPLLGRPISRPLQLSLTWLAMPCLCVRAQDQGRSSWRSQRHQSQRSRSQREWSQGDRSQGDHQPSDLGLAHYSAGCDAQVLVTGWSDLHTGARAPHMTSSHALSSARALVLAASARLRARRAAASQAAPARVRRFAARSCPVCHPP